MKRAALALIGLSALATAPSAFAAPRRAPPPPPLPVWNWTGFYGGANIGYSWGNSNSTLTLSDATTGAPLFAANNSFSLDGIIGGGQIGYNWQSTNWVFGLEADIQGSGEDGNTAAVCPGGALGTRTVAGLSGTCSLGHLGDTAPFDVAAFPVTDSLSEKLEWFGTVRARLGSTFIRPTLLAYITGGFAYGGISATDTISGTNILGMQNTNGSTLSPVAASFGGNTTRGGWTIGGGLEGVLWENWTGKIEYLYIDLGTISGSFITPVVAPSGNFVAASFSSHITDNVLRVGLNYHLR